MPTEKKIFTDSGIEVKELYQSTDTQPAAEMPGEFPCTYRVAHLL